MFVRGLLLLSIIFTLSCQNKSKKAGKSMYLTIGSEPSTLNPMVGNDGHAAEVLQYLHETLLAKDLDTWEWKPALATEWKISEDKKIFDFKLREGVKWHDGQEFTAEDVKFSYDVIYSDDYKAVQVRTFYDSIKEVQVIDKYNVRFIVKDDYFLNFEVCAGIEVLPKHLYGDKKRKSEWGKKLIGTGPYLFTKYDKGQKIILVKNPDWWGNKDPHEKETYLIPKLVLRFASEENVTLELLKKGDLDYLNLRPEAFVKKTEGKVWEERIVKVKAENKAPKGYNFIAFNFKNPILKDREVRKALSMLFNRPFMQEKFEYGFGEMATGPVYVQSDYADPNVKPVPYDPQGALAILNKAGWKDTDKDGLLDKVINGKKTALSITILDPMETLMKYLTVYKEDASKVGVEINIKVVEWNSFMKLIDERNFEAIRLAWGGTVEWDPKQIWHTDSAKGAGSNFISYSNPEVDKLIEEARRISEREKRAPMLQKVYASVANDYPYIFWFNARYSLYAHTKRIAKPKDTFKYSIGQMYWKLQ